MNSCIVTIIKNEHLYLDEWISYHLSIGINHIFIFEDIGSESHKNITDKYRNSVTLNSIDIVLNRGELNRIKFLKTTKISNPQYIYTLNILNYIKNNFNYNWCFVIDSDEFITLENPSDDLNNILSLYNDYDVLVLSWKCYGANGLVNTPNYSTKGVLETYTEPSKGYIHGIKPLLDKKYAYHIPTCPMDMYASIEKINYCNPEYNKDRVGISYKNIYLRHYITKSWEEYVWKKFNRGYFMGLNRTLEAFFKLNPDMKNLREKLLLRLEKETLVVFPYSNKETQEEKIKLILKSWRKFCKSQYHFVMIGEYDKKLLEEFPWIEFIFVPNKLPILDQYNPHLDILNKMKITYDLFKNKYEGFVWVTGNSYAIKPFIISDLLIIYSHIPGFVGIQTSPTESWEHDKWKTRLLLDKRKMNHTDFTTYLPCYFEFKKLKHVWDMYNMNEKSYVIEDIYFNSFKHEVSTPSDTIILNISIFNNDFLSAIENSDIKFISCNAERWNKELELALLEIVKN